MFSVATSCSPTKMRAVACVLTMRSPLILYSRLTVSLILAIVCPATGC
ncbi:hypothetical protein [Erwinia sp. TECH1]